MERVGSGWTQGRAASTRPTRARRLVGTDSQVQFRFLALRAAAWRHWRSARAQKMHNDWSVACNDRVRLGGCCEADKTTL